MRVWAGVLAVLVAAGLVWWFSDSAPSSLVVPLDGDEAVDEPGDEAVDEERAVPVLEGSAGAAPLARAVEGRYPITGVVVDEKDRPIAGVPVELWRSSYVWPGRGYDAVLQGNVTRVRSRVGALLGGRDTGEVEVATGTSDAEGRFAFRVDKAHFHTVYARPEPPAAGGYASAELIEGMRPSADVKVRVFAGVPLKGKVVYTDGRPVAAQVKAVHGSAWKAFAASDPETGTFRFDAAPSEEITCVVTLAGGRQYGGFELSPPFEGVVLTVPNTGATIRGTVQAADGSPIGGALVNLHLKLPGDKKWRESVELAARCDAGGRFVFEGLPAGEITRTGAYAEGYLADAQYAGNAGFAAVALAKDGTAVVDLSLRRGSVVHGRVTRKEDEGPIGGATVSLYFRGFHPPQATTRTTDANGRYRFEGIGDGKFMVLASHPQHYASELEAALAQQPNRRGDPPPHLAAVFTKNDVSIERDLVLARGMRLGGVVLGPAGQPAAGAKVFVREHGLRAAGSRWGMSFHGEEDPVVVAGDDGRFAIDGLAPRSNWVLFARKVGTSGIYTEAVSLADGSRDDVVVRLAPQCIVRGRVLDADGKPLPDQEIYVTGWSFLRGGPQKCTSQEDGRFELHSLPAKELGVSASRGEQRIQTKIEGLTVGEVREGVLLQFGRQVEITGIVRTSTGAPVPKLRILTTRHDGLDERREVRTDANGAFRFTRVTPGRLSLSVSDGRRRRHIAGPLEVPTSPLAITYDAPTVTTIEGRVLGPDGTPVPSGTVRVGYDNGKWTPGRPFTGGRFRVEVSGKPPFAVAISDARAADGTGLNLQPVHTPVPEPSKPVTIHLAAGVGASGRVVDTEGKGIVGVAVQAAAVSTQTDQDGRWEVSGLQPGRITLVIKPPTGFIPPGPRVVESGAVDILIKLERGVSISGRVSVPDGYAVTGGRISARWPRQGRYAAGRASGRIREGGPFTLSGVPPGVVATLDAQLWQSRDAIPLAPVVVDGIAAGRTDVVIEFEAGVAVTGSVVNADGTPFVDGGVSLQRDSGTGTYGQLQRDGSFTVTGLRPGTYRLFVFRGGRPIGSMREVTAPATNVRIVLPEEGAISGRLIDPPKGERWVVAPVDAATGSSPPSSSATVAADGTWTISSVDKGRKWVVIARRGDGPSDRYAQSAPLEVGATDVELTLQTGASITGRTMRDGVAVPHCGIQVRGPGWLSYGVSDAGGTYALRGLPPGRYRLQVRNLELGGKGTREDVAAGSTGVDVELSAR